MLAAAEGAPPENRVKTGLEAAIAFAETNPAAARATLSDLRADHATLRRIEACLGRGEDESTFALGAAMQVALTELNSPSPDLRRLLPELTRWLESDW